MSSVYILYISSECTGLKGCIINVTVTDNLILLYVCLVYFFAFFCFVSYLFIFAFFIFIFCCFCFVGRKRNSGGDTGGWRTPPRYTEHPFCRGCRAQPAGKGEIRGRCRFYMSQSIATMILFQLICFDLGLLPALVSPASRLAVATIVWFKRFRYPSPCSAVSASIDRSLPSYY